MGKNGLVHDVPKCSRFANICLNSAVVNFVRFQAWQRAARTVEIRYCHVRTFIQRYCTEMCPENLRSEDGLHLEHIQLFWSSLALLPEIPVWPSEVRSPLYIGSSLGTASRVWCRIQFVSVRNHGVLAGWLETSLAARYLGSWSCISDMILAHSGTSHSTRSCISYQYISIIKSYHLFIVSIFFNVFNTSVDHWWWTFCHKKELWPSCSTCIWQCRWNVQFFARKRVRLSTNPSWASHLKRWPGWWKLKM